MIGPQHGRNAKASDGSFAKELIGSLCILETAIISMFSSVYRTVDYDRYTYFHSGSTFQAFCGKKTHTNCRLMIGKLTGMALASRSPLSLICQPCMLPIRTLNLHCPPLCLPHTPRHHPSIYFSTLTAKFHVGLHVHMSAALHSTHPPEAKCRGTALSKLQ